MDLEIKQTVWFPKVNHHNFQRNEKECYTQESKTTHDPLPKNDQNQKRLTHNLTAITQVIHPNRKLGLHPKPGRIPTLKKFTESIKDNRRRPRASPAQGLIDRCAYASTINPSDFMLLATTDVDDLSFCFVGSGLALLGVRGKVQKY